jgi:hypothetical protein
MLAVDAQNELIAGLARQEAEPIRGTRAAVAVTGGEKSGDDKGEDLIVSLKFECRLERREEHGQGPTGVRRGVLTYAVEELIEFDASSGCLRRRRHAGVVRCFGCRK